MMESTPMEKTKQYELAKELSSCLWHTKNEQKPHTKQTNTKNHANNGKERVAFCWLVEQLLRPLLQGKSEPWVACGLST